MFSKVLLIIEVLILILIAIIIWYYDYDGIQVIVIICVVSISIVITGYFEIRKQKETSNETQATNIEASCESMLAPDSDIAIEANRRHRLQNASTLSDDSLVLQQSYFSPQIVSAIIENEDKQRDSVISNNEVPPTYEEAQHLPKLSPKV